MKTKNYFPPTGILSVILIMLVMLGAGTNQHLKANQPNMPGIAIDAPVALDASEITDISFKANWQSVSNAEYYELYVYKKVGTLVTGQPMYVPVSGYDGRQVQGTSIVVQGLSAGLQYKYHVVAIGSQYEESVSSNSILVTTKLTGPVATDATNKTPVSFTANWNAVEGASMYNVVVIYRYGGVIHLKEGSTANTSLDFNELVPAIKYDYAVKAVVSGVETLASNTISVTLPAATPPTLKAASKITHNSFQANWNQANGATSYKIYVSKRATKLSWEVLKTYNGKTVTGLNTLVDGLNADTEYKYELKAVYNTHESELSESVTLFTLPEAPVASAATSVTTNSFQSNWGAVNGATGYKLWVWSNENTGYSPEGYFPATLGNVTSHVLSNLESGHGYSYFVQTITANGTSIVSNTINVVTESNTINQYTLTLSLSPSGVGSVSGGGTFNEGTTVTAHASANTGFAFVNWTENGKVVSSSASYVFQISANRNLVANFSQIPATRYTIALTASPSNMGSVSGGGDYPQGTDVTVSATPASKAYRFVNWTEGGTQVSTSESYTFTIAGNRNLVANFVAQAPTTYTIALSASPANGGTVSGGGTFNAGITVTAHAAPMAGYTFVNWTENGSIVSTSVSYIFQVTSNRNLVANFVSQTPTTYTVALSASPANGGTVSGGGTFNAGITVTAHAAPMAGYTFVNWTENGSIVSTSVSYIFQVTSNRNLVANFVSQTPTTYTVALSASPANGGTVSGGGTFNAGITVTAHAAPMAGYTFVNWTENGSIVSTSVSYIFQVTSNRNLIANFELIAGEEYSVDLSVAPAASGTVSGAGSFESGSSVTVSATAANGYNFLNWTEGENIVSSSAIYTFTITSDRSLKANFEPKMFTITLTANPSSGGFTNFASSQFAFGQNVTVNANQNSNYTFVSWTENGVIVSTNKSFTFTAEANRSLVANFIIETGAEDINEITMLVYPNPTTGIVHVSGISEGAELKVTDISGRLVHSVKADNSTVILDLSSVRHGVYFIRVDDKQYHSTKRVILR